MPRYSKRYLTNFELILSCLQCGPRRPPWWIRSEISLNLGRYVINNFMIYSYHVSSYGTWHQKEGYGLVIYLARLSEIIHDFEILAALRFWRLRAQPEFFCSYWILVTLVNLHRWSPWECRNWDQVYFI